MKTQPSNRGAAAMPAAPLISYPARNAIGQAAFYVVSIAIAVFMFLPFFWSIMTSLKPSEPFASCDRSRTPAALERKSASDASLPVDKPAPANLAASASARGASLRTENKRMSATALLPEDRQI